MSEASPPPNSTSRGWRPSLNLRQGEGGLVLLGMLYHFCLLACNYILRPVRDEIGSAYREGLAEAWTWVFFVMLPAAPLYAFLVSRWPRRVFIPLVNSFFLLCLIGFAWLLEWLPEDSRQPLEWTFYVWHAVFNMFIITGFWGFMVDLFHHEQSKRLFGLLFMGGSLGGIAGPLLAGRLVEPFGRTGLMVVAMVFLVGATCTMLAMDRTALCSRRLHSYEDQKAQGRQAPGGGVWQGLAVVFRSPYLLGICGYLFLHSLHSTFLYFTKANIAREAFVDRAARTEFYANVDLLTNALTLLAQMFLTAKVLKKIGVGWTLVLLPLLSLIGFAALGTWTTLAVLVSFEVLRRATHYGLSKPAREVLFTVVSREQKYKAKAFIDTVVYRGSDVTSARLFEGLQAGFGFAPLALGLQGIAYCAVPLAALWALLAANLGKQQVRRQERLAESGIAKPQS
ncbi:MAG: MFS transporter [Planctomycetota bacterium]|nr:MAG: MFS transporter [Planctomycetota bacterium]